MRATGCLIHGLPALCLLLCVSTLVRWDHGLKAWARERQQMTLRLQAMEDEFFARRTRGVWLDHPPVGDIPPGITALRTQLARVRPRPDVERFLDAAGILAIPPFVWLAYACWYQHRRVMRAKRRKRGKCPACAYDLTCNVSGVCPECGTAVGTPGASHA